MEKKMIHTKMSARLLTALIIGLISGGQSLAAGAAPVEISGTETRVTRLTPLINFAIDHHLEESINLRVTKLGEDLPNLLVENPDANFDVLMPTDQILQGETPEQAAQAAHVIRLLLMDSKTLTEELKQGANGPLAQILPTTGTREYLRGAARTVGRFTGARKDLAELQKIDLANVPEIPALIASLVDGSHMRFVATPAASAARAEAAVVAGQPSFGARLASTGLSKPVARAGKSRKREIPIPVYQLTPQERSELEVYVNSHLATNRYGSGRIPSGQKRVEFESGRYPLDRAKGLAWDEAMREMGVRNWVIIDPSPIEIQRLADNRRIFLVPTYINHAQPTRFVDTGYSDHRGFRTFIDQLGKGNKMMSTRDNFTKSRAYQDSFTAGRTDMMRIVHASDDPQLFADLYKQWYETVNRAEIERRDQEKEGSGLDVANFVDDFAGAAKTVREGDDSERAATLDELKPYYAIYLYDSSEPNNPHRHRRMVAGVLFEAKESESRLVAHFASYLEEETKNRKDKSKDIGPGSLALFAGGHWIANRLGLETFVNGADLNFFDGDPMKTSQLRKQQERFDAFPSDRFMLLNVLDASEARDINNKVNQDSDEPSVGYAFYAIRLRSPSHRVYVKSWQRARRSKTLEPIGPRDSLWKKQPPDPGVNWKPDQSRFPYFDRNEVYGPEDVMEFHFFTTSTNPKAQQPVSPALRENEETRKHIHRHQIVLPEGK